jgi:hypothetical protein
MIEYTERIKMMLDNILYKVDVNQKDLERNGSTHYRYILEKLNSAKWDLDILINEAKEKDTDLYDKDI